MSTAEASARPGLLRRIYAWTLRNAEGPRAWAILALFAFAESSFFPVPADILLVPMLLADRRRSFLLGAWATLWSVLGGMLGYVIGHLLFNTVGHWLISIYGIASSVDDLRNKFVQNAWLIALQGMTPISYKIVTIAAGIAGVNFWFFIVLSTFTRGFRYGVEATLFYVLGERARILLEKYLGFVLLGALVVIVAGIYAIKFVF